MNEQETEIFESALAEAPPPEAQEQHKPDKYPELFKQFDEARKTLDEKLRRERIDEVLESQRLPLLGFARKHSRNEDDAMDAVQETLLKIYQNADAFREQRGDTLRIWMYTILKNVMRDRGRRLAKLDEVSLEELSEKPTVQNSEQKRDVFQALEPDFSEKLIKEMDEKRGNRFQQAFSSLSVNHQKVIAMHHFEGKELVDVAKELGIEEGTVKSRLARARQELARKIGRPELMTKLENQKKPEKSIEFTKEALSQENKLSESSFEKETN